MVQPTVRSFNDPNEPAQRTLILLDEVDHLSGGLRAVSDARPRTIDGRRGQEALKGDSVEKQNCCACWRKPVSPLCWPATT